MVSTRPGCEVLEVRFDVKTRTGHIKTISWVFTESPDAKKLVRERARKEAINLLTDVDSSCTVFSNPNITLTERLSARVEIVELEYADVVGVSMRDSERVLQLKNPHIWKTQKAKIRITFSGRLKNNEIRLRLLGLRIIVLSLLNVNKDGF